MKRTLDWLRQSKRNLRSAEVNFEAELYEETCYESHQAAEKALKALLNFLGLEKRGHSLLFLAKYAQENGVEIPDDIMNCILELDKHYIPSRYPDVFDEGAPVDYYTIKDAERCLECGKRIVEWISGVVEKKTM